VVDDLASRSPKISVKKKKGSYDGDPVTRASQELGEKGEETTHQRREGIPILPILLGLGKGIWIIG